MNDTDLEAMHAFATSPDDLELNVMETLRATLEPFDRRTRRRILRYLFARFVEEK